MSSMWQATLISVYDERLGGCMRGLDFTIYYPKKIPQRVKSFITLTHPTRTRQCTAQVENNQQTQSIHPPVQRLSHQRPPSHRPTSPTTPSLPPPQPNPHRPPDSKAQPNPASTKRITAMANTRPAPLTERPASQEAVVYAFDRSIAWSTAPPDPPSPLLPSSPSLSIPASGAVIDSRGSQRSGTKRLPGCRRFGWVVC